MERDTWAAMSPISRRWFPAGPGCLAPDGSGCLMWLKSRVKYTEAGMVDGRSGGRAKMAEAGTKRWTLAEIEALPYDEWTRYEIIDGELFVSTAPGHHHQAVCTRGAVALGTWNDRSG